MLNFILYFYVKFIENHVMINLESKNISFTYHGSKKNILLLIGKLPIPRSEESIAQAFTDNRKSVILETLVVTEERRKPTAYLEQH
jgi:hypothetical protein